MAFDPATALFDFGKELISRLIPDKAKAAEVSAKLEELHTNGSLQEMATNADLDKAYLVDRQSARDRDVELTKATGKRNWRPDIMFFMAVFVVAGLVWIVWKDPAINEYVKGIFTLVLGRFLGYLDNIFNFEFGSTRSSKDKDVTIKNLSGN